MLIYWWRPCCSYLCYPIMCIYVTISALKRCSVRLYLQLFVEVLMSYFRYFCLCAHGGVQHILCCVFVLFVFVLFTLCCQFLWIVHFLLPLRRSLMHIEMRKNKLFNVPTNYAWPRQTIKKNLISRKWYNVTVKTL
jgi:hypothetical protein